MFTEWKGLSSEAALGGIEQTLHTELRSDGTIADAGDVGIGSGSNDEGTRHAHVANPQGTCGGGLPAACSAI